MSRADIDAKLDATSAGVLDDERRDAIRQAWWNVADATDIGIPMAATADFGLEVSV